MSDTTSQEPTMEEILASIRRIISEDEAPADGAQPAAEAEPEAEAAPIAAPAFDNDPQVDEDEALELTERVEQVGDLDVYSPTVAPAAEAPAPSYEDAAPSRSIEVDEGLVSAASATAAASAFGQLSSAIGMPKVDRTLEDVVRELLRPLLKDWLDANLPRIVEAAVAEEVERIARRQVR